MKANIVLALITGLAFSPMATSAEKPTDKKKQTQAGLYLTAKEAFEKLEKDKASQKVLFIDIRSRSEINFLGMPQIADANIPYMNVNEWFTWDKEKQSFKMDPNNDFSTELERRLKDKKLTKTDEIILMCRSGDRSAKAADLLHKQGYTKVYSMVDGYEGDVVKDGPHKGHRTVNGWKNANLPWTYKLDLNKMYKVATK